MCKWIMDLGATKLTTLHRAVLNTYKVIPPHNVSFGDNNIAETIGIESIVVEVERKKRKTKKFASNMYFKYLNCKQTCYQ